MKGKNRLAAAGIFLCLGVCMALPVNASKNDGGNGSLSITEKVEKTITRASDMFEQGKMIKGHPYIARISPRLTLTFAAESFDADLEKAFKVLDVLMTQAREKSRVKNNPPGKTGKISPTSSPKPDIRKKAPPRDRISALMQAENQHPKQRKLTAREVPVQFSTFKNYNALHQGRAIAEDRAAEADMQAVNQERQMAEEELRQRRARKQQIQVQAMKWQNQLDKEAAESARKTAAYEAEHSFGSYVKRFFTTVLQTAVGSFTGAFVGNIGSHLADKAVSSLFHGSSDSAAAVGMSTAINSTASAAGQSVSGGASPGVKRKVQY